MLTAFSIRKESFKMLCVPSRVGHTQAHVRFLAETTHTRIYTLRRVCHLKWWLFLTVLLSQILENINYELGFSCHNLLPCLRFLVWLWKCDRLYLDGSAPSSSFRTEFGVFPGTGITGGENRDSGEAGARARADAALLSQSSSVALRTGAGPPASVWVTRWVWFKRGNKCLVSAVPNVIIWEHGDLWTSERLPRWYDTHICKW